MQTHTQYGNMALHGRGRIPPALVWPSFSMPEPKTKNLPGKLKSFFHRGACLFSHPAPHNLACSQEQIAYASRLDHPAQPDSTPVKSHMLCFTHATRQLCVMIKARVGLEETYAKGLEKVANQVGRVRRNAWVVATGRSYFRLRDFCACLHPPTQGTSGNALFLQINLLFCLFTTTLGRNPGCAFR